MCDSRTETAKKCSVSDAFTQGTVVLYILLRVRVCNENEQSRTKTKILMAISSLAHLHKIIEITCECA